MCPRCGSQISATADGYSCSAPECAFYHAGFPTVVDLPALIDFDDSVLSSDELSASAGAAQILRDPAANPAKRWLARFLHPMNARARSCISQMLELANAQRGQEAPLVLVVGGGAVGQGTEELYTSRDATVIGFDIYRSPNVAFLADAHRVPLSDESVDAVVVQAVLEHVLEPQRVVDEIHRVLKPDGLVYADTPFMQAVHDGPYDFTRFTESGHRFLFRRFNVISSGAVAGPGTALAWSVDYFVRGLTRSRTAGLIARLAVFWLSYFDEVIDPRFAVDGASSVYFFGSKSSEVISPREMISHYQGGQ